MSALNEEYTLLIKQLTGLIENEKDLIANLANCSALLFQSLENVNWAGFYLLKAGELVLGPFQGLPACIRIPLGQGVCGTAAQNKETQLVADVHQFPGHIACDASSNSEIVVPLIHPEKGLLGVLDIDSTRFDRFSEEDKAGLEALARTLMYYC